MYRTISAIQEKGGIGKTTLTTIIASGLAIRGLRVLAIDTDAQAHLTVGMGLKPEPGIYELIIRERGFDELVRVVDPSRYAPAGSTPSGTLAVLPGNIETMNVNVPGGNAYSLQQRLEEIDGIFDVVVYDTPPTPSFLHAPVMVSSDFILLPAEMEFYCLKALSSTMKHIPDFSSMRVAKGLSPIRILGIIPTMMRSVVEHEENLKTLREEHGDLVWPPMPLRITWAEASMQRKTVFAYDPDGKAAQDAWTVVDNVMGALEHV